MTDFVLLDNDIAFKVAIYQLVEIAIELTTRETAPPAMLTVGQFVIRKKLHRHPWIRDVPAAQSAFERLLLAVDFVEPVEEELALASEIEAEATRAGLDLDSGESQLLAILHIRECGLLVTGDKRAVVAMAAVARGMSEGRIQCLEQLLAQMLAIMGFQDMRARICSEPAVDRAVSACFSCASLDTPPFDQVQEGLGSYIEHLRGQAPGILIDDIGVN